jgi:hypothetical protein
MISHFLQWECSVCAMRFRNPQEIGEHFKATGHYENYACVSSDLRLVVESSSSKQPELSQENT